ncbi:axonemal dynein light intermediate polypeptide 1 isoform X2 [Nyctibius grandis]|uniref:axonemal dynein light intermediate polypeptide 1 isoform X2 n=1 Tax=Nyctibius grandis TaxID=48427 RepID=UPI0035BBA2FF
MIPPPDSLLQYNPPVLVSRRTEKRSPGVSPPAEGDPAAARPDRARPAAGPDGGRRRAREAAAGAAQRHPAAAGVGGGQPAVGAGGVQHAQHPRGRRPAAGAPGPAAAAAAGAGDRPLPRAQGALLAVLRAALRGAAKGGPAGRGLFFPASPQLFPGLTLNTCLSCQLRDGAFYSVVIHKADTEKTCCKDELIRETTINCAERGLLLLRVRDEIQMTIAAYQTLYESSVVFGTRKALQAEQGKADMEERITKLEEEKQELERQVSDEKARCKAIENRENERRQIEEKKHAEEVQLLKRTNQQLKAQLESIIAPNKNFLSSSRQRSEKLSEQEG